MRGAGDRANTSSLPEVIGRDDALFDPHDDKSIAAKLSQVLTDKAFRRALAQHGLEQARQFSWDITAKTGAFRVGTVLPKQREIANQCQRASAKAGLYFSTAAGTQRYQ